jgi:hypothetical protein
MARPPQYDRDPCGDEPTRDATAVKAAIKHLTESGRARLLAWLCLHYQDSGARSRLRSAGAASGSRSMALNIGTPDSIKVTRVIFLVPETTALERAHRPRLAGGPLPRSNAECSSRVVAPGCQRGQA